MGRLDMAKNTRFRKNIIEAVKKTLERRGQDQIGSAR